MQTITGTVTRILHSNLLEVTTPEGTVKVRSVDEDEPMPIGTAKNVVKYYMNKYLEREVTVEVLEGGDMIVGRVTLNGER